MLYSFTSECITCKGKNNINLGMTTCSMIRGSGCLKSVKYFSHLRQNLTFVGYLVLAIRSSTVYKIRGFGRCFSIGMATGHNPLKLKKIQIHNILIFFGVYLSESLASNQVPRQKEHGPYRCTGDHVTGCCCKNTRIT